MFVLGVAMLLLVTRVAQRLFNALAVVCGPPLPSDDARCGIITNSAGGVQVIIWIAYATSVAMVLVPIITLLRSQRK
jgi:hypothetical protein